MPNNNTRNISLDNLQENPSIIFNLLPREVLRNFDPNKHQDLLRNEIKKVAESNGLEGEQLERFTDSIASDILFSYNEAEGMRNDLGTMTDNQFYRRYGVSKNEVVTKGATQAYQEAPIVQSNEDFRYQAAGEDFANIVAQSSALTGEIFSTAKNRIADYANQLNTVRVQAKNAVDLRDEAQRNITAEYLKNAGTLLQSRQNRLTNLSDMVNKHNIKFGSALNDKAIDVLKTFANIAAPTFTSIMLGWEMARQSEADRSAQAIAMQANLDDQALKLEEAQAKYYEDVAKSTFQRDLDRANAEIEYFKGQGIDVENQQKLFSELERNVASGTVNIIDAAARLQGIREQLQTQREMNQSELENQLKIAQNRDETQLKIAQDRGETQVEVAEIRSAASRYATDMKGMINERKSENEMMRDYFKFIYARELGLLDADKRERLLGMRLDYEYDKMDSEESRYLLGLADKERQREYMMERAQWEIDAKKEIQNIITDRVLRVAGDQIDAKRMMQLALFEHKNKAQQEEFNNDISLLRLKGELDLANTILKIEGEAKQREADREERRQALERKIEATREAIDRRAENDQEAIRLKADLDLVRDEIQRGYDVEDILTQHRNRLEEIDRVAGFNQEASLNNFIYRYALGERRYEAQLELASLNNEAENERLATNLAAKREITQAGFDQETLMLVLRADREDERLAQRHKNELEKIAEKFEGRGQLDEARQVRDFIFQSELNKQNNQAAYEREQMRLESWERRERERSQAQDLRLQASLNAKADQILYKHYSDTMLQDQKHAGVMELFNAQATANRENLLSRLESNEFIAAARLEQNDVESIRNFINEAENRAQRGEQFDRRLTNEAERIDKMLQSREKIAGLNNDVRLELGRMRNLINSSKDETNLFFGSSRSVLSNYVRYLDVERKAQRDKDNLTQAEKNLLEKGRQFDKKLEESARQANQMDEFNRWKTEMTSWTTTNAQLLRNQGALDVVNVREAHETQRKFWELELRKNQLQGKEKLEYERLAAQVKKDNDWIEQHVEDRNTKFYLMQRGQDISYARTVLQEMNRNQRELDRINAQRERDSETNKLRREELQAKIKQGEDRLKAIGITQEGRLELGRLREQSRLQGIRETNLARERIALGGQSARIETERIRQSGQMARLVRKQAFEQARKQREDKVTTEAMLYMQEVLNATSEYGPTSKQAKDATAKLRNYLDKDGVILDGKVSSQYLNDVNKATQIHAQRQARGRGDEAAVIAALQGAASPNETATPEERMEANKTTLLRRIAATAHQAGINLTGDEIRNLGEEISGEGNEYVPDKYASVLSWKDLDARVSKALTDFVDRRDKEQKAVRVKEAEERNVKNRSVDQWVRYYADLSPDQVEAIPDQEIREARQKLGITPSGNYSASKYRQDLRGSFRELMIRKYGGDSNSETPRQEEDKSQQPGASNYSPFDENQPEEQYAQFNEDQPVEEYAQFDQNKATASGSQDVSSFTSMNVPETRGLAEETFTQEDQPVAFDFYNTGGTGMAIQMIPDDVEGVQQVEPMQPFTYGDDTLNGGNPYAAV